MNWLPIVLPDGSLLWSQFFCLGLSAAPPFLNERLRQAASFLKPSWSVWRAAVGHVWSSNGWRWCGLVRLTGSCVSVDRFRSDTSSISVPEGAVASGFNERCVVCIFVCVVVMRGWHLYPRALRMIRGSGGLGNKTMHSDYLQVGCGWIWYIINDANLNCIFKICYINRIKCKFIY